jgi:hypothetical protein
LTKDFDTGALNSPITFTPTNHFGTIAAQVVSYKGCRMQNLGKTYTGTRVSH